MIGFRSGKDVILNEGCVCVYIYIYICLYMFEGIQTCLKVYLFVPKHQFCIFRENGFYLLKLEMQ